MGNYGRVWEKNLLPAPGEGYAGKNNNFVCYQLPKRGVQKPSKQRQRARTTVRMRR